MTTSVNVSALSDDELLVFVEEGYPPACHEAAGRLREIVSDGYYNADEIEEARENGRESFAGGLHVDYAQLLWDLAHSDDSPLDQEQRKKIGELYDRIVGAS